MYTVKMLDLSIPNKARVEVLGTTITYKFLEMTNSELSIAVFATV